MTETDPSAESTLLARLAGLSTTSLADASKATTPLRVLPRELQPVRAGSRLLGRALTVDARGNLLSMMAALKLAGPNDVLVVSGGEGGAVAGELFASEAQRLGVTGIVIDGFCRDRATLAELDIPVYARGSVPWAPPANALPVVQVPIVIGSVVVSPDDLLVGDADGIVVGTVAELTAVVEGAEAIETYETSLRDAIQAGSSLLDHVNYDEHLAALHAGQDSKIAFS